MKKFLIALQFLTILPIQIRAKIVEKEYGESLAYFPLVGLMIGLVLASMVSILKFLPSPVLAASVIIISLIITGGIHLDGFVDTCDGLYGLHPKEKILEVMRDSRTGTMGVVGVVSLLLLKFTLLISIPVESLWRPLIVMTVFSRWAQVVACYISKYPREEGKGKYFVEYAGQKELLISTLFTLVVISGLMRGRGMVLFIICFFVIFLFISYVRKRVGGATGDTIGATSELAEAVALLFSLILYKTQ